MKIWYVCLTYLNVAIDDFWSFEESKFLLVCLFPTPIKRYHFDKPLCNKNLYYKWKLRHLQGGLKLEPLIDQLEE